MIASTHSINMPPYAIGRASFSLSSCLEVVPEATNEWKPEIAPHAIVTNNAGNIVPRETPEPTVPLSMKLVKAGISIVG